MSVGQVLFRPPRRSGWWHSRPGYASTRWSCRARPLDVRGAMSVWRQRSRACERLRFRRVAVIYSRSTDAPLLIEVVLWPKLRGLVEGFGELRVTVGRSCSSSDISMSLLKRASASHVDAKSFVRGNPTPLEIAQLRANTRDLVASKTRGAVGRLQRSSDSFAHICEPLPGRGPQGFSGGGWPGRSTAQSTPPSGAASAGSFRSRPAIGLSTTDGDPPTR